MKPWRRRVHGKTPPCPALPHGTAINQNKPVQKQTPVTTTAKRRQQPVGATLVRPRLDNRLGASREHAPACLDTRIAGDTESGGYWIPGPASRHKQIFPGFRPPRHTASCNTVQVSSTETFWNQAVYKISAQDWLFHITQLHHEPDNIRHSK